MRWRDLLERRRRVACWLLAPTSLIAAVFERASEEPLLVACEQVRTAGDDATRRDFAPGLLETAHALHALGASHIAALPPPYCRLADRAAKTADALAQSGDFARVPVVMEASLAVAVRESTVRSVSRRFRDAGLHLVALDAADCALLSLGAYLDPQGAGQDLETRLAAARRLDPLAAVSVAETCEPRAARLGPDLAVPVGLALSHLGYLAHG